MRRLLERRFTAKVGAGAAWRHLEKVEAWPSWARHVEKVTLDPPGPLGPDSSGTIHLRGGPRSTFRMVELVPGTSWRWVGPFLWLTVSYDHRFRAIDDGATELTFLVDAEGPGVGLLGPLFAIVYARNLDRAIPRLVRELEAL
jgi:hypothetical protein